MTLALLVTELPVTNLRRSTAAEALLPLVQERGGAVYCEVRLPPPPEPGVSTESNDALIVSE